ncbi:glycosyltransferase [Vicingaceae bacterium]|nr:glycosyltransferase [Vicingaceae bacterium]
MADLKSPLVAIWMITYNHEDYIEKAVESVVLQEVNFDFKLFLSEDNSDDSTREKCIQLKRKYPDLIELFLPEKNLGVTSANGIGMQTYERCFRSGAKYIALLEGDDYWSDKNKLQIQVDFLESNTSYGSSFHRSSVINSKGETIKESKRLVYKDHLCANLVLGMGEMLTNTIMFRNNITLPKSFSSVSNGDTYLWYLLGFLGDCKFQEEIKPSAYRTHQKGVWSSANELERVRSMCKTYDAIYLDMIEKKINTQFIEKIVYHNLNITLVGYLKSIRFIKYLNLILFAKSLNIFSCCGFIKNHIIFLLSKFKLYAYSDITL